MTEAQIRWSCAGRSDRGAKRKINEDAILVRTEAGVWLAADGMGGHEAGDVASRMVADAVGRVRVDGKLSDVVDRVEEALVKVNLAIRDHSARAFGGRTMGSTVVSMVANDRLGACLWAGDSRLYRFRGGQLEQVSRDHSEVQELLERGLISEREAVNHPHSNVITRAVGGAPELFVDVTVFGVQANDIYVLCSDGLYNELDNDEIAAALAGDDIEQSADRLLQLALAKGARDNVSLLVVKALPVAGAAGGPVEDDWRVTGLARAYMEGDLEREHYLDERRAIIDRLAGATGMQDLAPETGTRTAPNLPALVIDPKTGAPVTPAAKAGDKPAGKPKATTALVDPPEDRPSHGHRDVWVGVVVVVLVLGVIGGLLAWLW